MRTRWMNMALCGGLLLSGGIVLADPPAKPAQTQNDRADQEFLEKALGVNQLELQLGQLAAQHAFTAEVKAMGQKMVEKHTELGQQLAELSRQAGGSGKVELSSDQRAIERALVGFQPRIAAAAETVMRGMRAALAPAA